MDEEVRIRRRVGRLLLGADVVGHECEISIGGDEREDSLRLPALESHTRVETHVVQESGILGEGKMETGSNCYSEVPA